MYCRQIHRYLKISYIELRLLGKQSRKTGFILSSGCFGLVIQQGMIPLDCQREVFIGLFLENSQCDLIGRFMLSLYISAIAPGESGQPAIRVLYVLLPRSIGLPPPDFPYPDKWIRAVL